MVDPWGGWFYVERLTYELAKRAWGHIQEVEELGGMAKAIEAGLPKLRIEEAAAKTQARIDAGQQSVIGVNKYRPEQEPAVSLLKVDNVAVRQLQIDKLARLKRERDPKAIEDALSALTRNAAGGNADLLALAIDAARAKATVGDLIGAGAGVRPPPRRDQGDHRRLQAGGRHHVGSRRTRAEARHRVRGERGAPPAHPGRQDRPGWPRD